ncbi:MarR family transcriptional regulator [Vagococcus intermedius]|uniref:Helix-turn-helix domain-containing protein n=1 Tax=Vagococcus intermedius TaxID=2991418 RepID=A0AAF0CWW6_9ENTE|nr:helix-turn-helix domain-containing protein [Vagococcus intermedius]WEG74212.1 helix-turn-helix domain-containing protein [Vagococcus intermedius]WEG76293.1 helix-turn-helix domain-containing protein [Vagococcus intermedius]
MLDTPTQLDYFNELDFKKITVYHHIITQEKITIHDLCQLTGYNRSTTTRLINKINEDLTELALDYFCIIKDKSIYFSPDFKDNDQHNPEKRLLLFYLNNSIAYQLTSTLAREKKVHIFKLCSDLSISHSYCLKELQKVKIILKQLGLTLTKTDNYYTIIGDVTCKIMINYFFKTITYDHTEELFQQSILRQKPLKLRKNFTSVSNDLKGFRLIKLEEAFLENKAEFDTFRLSEPSIKDIATSLFSFQPSFINVRNERFTDDQLIFMELALRSNVYEVISKENRIMSGYYLMKKHNHHPYVIKARFIIDSFLEFHHSQIDDDFYAESLYFFILKIFFSFEVTLDIKTNFFRTILSYKQDTFKNSAIMTMTRQFTENLFKENSWEFNSPKEQFMIEKLLSTIAIHILSKQVNIYIDTIKTPDVEMVLKNELNEVLSERSFNITNDYELANLVIIDYPISDISDKKTIFFNNHLSIASRKKLVMEIMTYYYDLLSMVDY